MNRRGFLKSFAQGAVIITAAPAIVRFDSLMKLPPKRLIIPTLYGDGVRDDTPALQWMIDNAHKTGGTVFLPKGEFRLTRPLVLRGGDRLVGFSPERSKLIGAPNQPVIEVNGADTTLQSLWFESSGDYGCAARYSQGAV